MNAPAAVREPSILETALHFTQLEVAIVDLFATVVVRHRYRNAGTTPIEAIFTFPMALDATLLGLKARIGERVLVGRVNARAEARDRYEDAVASGSRAILLERAASDLYTANVGNLMPGEAIDLELRFVQLLRPRDGQVRVTLPTTIAPRYGRSPLEPQALVEPSLLVEHPFAMSLVVDGVLAQLEGPSCPTHTLRRDHDGAWRIDGRDAVLDRDIVIRFDRVPAIAPRVYRCASRDGDVLLAAVPMPTATQRAAARRVVFLLDCSGSMQGDSIRMVRDAMRILLDELAPDDEFDIVRFGSRTSCLFEAPRPATPNALAHARRLVDSLAADLGGTELEAAVEQAAHALRGPGTIFLLSDGEVWLGKSDATATAAHLGVRIQSVAIGSAAVEATLRHLSERTGGHVEAVTPNESMSARIVRHFQRIGDPLVQGLRWQPDTRGGWAAMPHVVAHGEIAWMALHANKPVADPQVAFERNGETVTIQLEPAAPPVTLVEDIPRLAAALRISGTPPDEQSGLAEFAERFQLLTEWTACLLVDDELVADDAPLPTTTTVPHMLAAGYGGSGRVLEDSLCAPGAMKVMGVEMCRGSFDVLRCASRADLRENLDLPASSLSEASIIEIAASAAPLDWHDLARRLSQSPRSDAIQQALHAIGWDDQEQDWTPLVVAILLAARQRSMLSAVLRHHGGRAPRAAVRRVADRLASSAPIEVRATELCAALVRMPRAAIAELSCWPLA